jgi:hypothetical protein
MPAEVKENKIPKTTLSSLYCGERYGFSQRIRYIQQLDKYVNLYDDKGKEIYGYQKLEYVSPAMIQNLITTPNFTSTSGWIGSRRVRDNKKA